MGRKAKLAADQKQEVVLKLLRREEPAAALARRYGITETTLYRWREEFIAGGKAALINGKVTSEQSSKRIHELERELEEQKRVNDELTIANRVFKKLSEGLS